MKASLSSIGTHARVGHEIAVGIQDFAGAPSGQGDAHHCIADIARIGVILAHANQCRDRPVVRAQRHAVGVPIALRRQGFGIGARREAIQALIGKLGVIGRIPDDEVRRGSILMHAAAHIADSGNHRNCRAARAEAKHAVGTAGRRHIFGPVQTAIDAAQILKSDL